MPAASATAPAFDPVKYKLGTRAQWDAAAGAWHRWGPTLSDWLGEATRVMLDQGRVERGSHVLDVAAGAGGQTISAARRVGPEGRVVATDISGRILEFAQTAAREAGLGNVETVVQDGEDLEFPADSFDAVISRVGLIYFPDQQRALAGMHRVLKPGGRMAAVTYSTPENNPFFSIPISIIRRRAQLPPPAPGQPGPFSLGKEGVMETAFAGAGFRDVRVQKIASPLRLASAKECVRFERESFGALHQMLSGMPDSEWPSVWQEIERELAQFEGPAGFVGPCEMLVAVGSK
jgi:SAM-dependent methyltransferase